MRILATWLVLTVGTTITFGKEKKDKDFVFSTPKALGLNLISSDTIKGVQHTFPNTIKAISIDSATGKLAILSYYDKGEIYGDVSYLALFEPRTGEFLWQKRAKPARRMQTTPRHLVLSSDKASHCYSRQDGKMLWKKDYTWLQPLGKTTDLGVTTEGKVVDLQTGKTVWKRKLRGKYYVEDVVSINDSTFLIAQGGLHIASKMTGEGVSFTDNFEDRSREGKAALSFLSAMTFITAPATGMVGYVKNPEPTQGLCSRILIENELAYYATREKLTCIDLKENKLVWESTLDHNKTSSSVIRSDNESIYVLNTGLGYNAYGSVLRHGEPYLAIFNKTTGVQSHFEELPIDLILEKMLYEDQWTIALNNNQISFDLLEKEKEDLIFPNKRPMVPKARHWMAARANGMFRSILNGDNIELHKNQEKVAEFKNISAFWFEGGNFCLISDNKLLLVGLDQF